MKMLNVIPVAAIVLSCTMISFPINSAEGRGPGAGGGGGGGAVGFSGGGGRGGGGAIGSRSGAIGSRSGAIGSRSGAIANRGAFVGNRGAVTANRGAFVGNRGGAYAGTQGAYAGNRAAYDGSRAAYDGSRAAYAGNNAYVGSRNTTIGNRSGLVAGDRAGSASVRRALPVAPATTRGFAGAQAVSQSALAANPAFVGESLDRGRGFRSDRRFDSRSGRGSDRFGSRSDWRGSQRSDRRAIPLYYYGFNFYPSYGFDLYDYAPVTVDENGRPFDRRFVRSNDVVRVPGAILPVAGAPRTVEVQLALRNRGFYGGPIDGVIGTQSRGAIRAFQYANGLPVTGGIDSRMFTVLMRGF